MSSCCRRSTDQGITEPRVAPISSHGTFTIKEAAQMATSRLRFHHFRERVSSAERLKLVSGRLAIFEASRRVGADGSERQVCGP